MSESAMPACGTCGRSVSREDRFCSGCGATLGGGGLAGADAEMAALGRALGASYAVERLLGRGGMGAVYLARETALERVVAVKVVARHARDGDATERFRREARTAARLSHPNIVPLYTFGETGELLYFVMGYVQGESLGDRLRRDGAMPAHEVRGILEKLADALAYAHRQGVVHRDLKPDNILVDDRTGNVLLADFGVARMAASGQTLTGAGVAVGTPYYMSPEQAVGDPNVDHRSDLYSLGATAYHLLAGRVPFEGGSAQDVMAQHVTLAPPALGAIRPETPPDLVYVVTRCLQKSREARWQDAEALKAALSPLPGEEADLPEHARIGRAVVGGGLKASLAAPFVVWISGLWNVPDGGLGWEILLPLFGMVPLGLAAALLKGRSDGFDPRSTLRMVLQEPRSWRLWYPRPLRRPGSIWSRLPAFVRGARTLLLGATVLAAAAALVGLAYVWSPTASPEGRDLVGGLMLVGSTAFVVVASGAFVAVTLWGKGRGLSGREAIELVLEVGRTPRLLAQPRIQRLLLPADGPDAAPARIPADHLQAIIRAARSLSGPLQELGQESVGAARSLLSSIQRLEQEIALLRRDVDPGEAAQLERRLAALQSGEPTPERSKMQQLLAEQLHLVSRLRERLEQGERRRERLLALLRTLSLRLADLAAERAAAARDVSEVSGTIRALCDEIGHHAMAVEETVKLETAEGQSG